MRTRRRDRGFVLLLTLVLLTLAVVSLAALARRGSVAAVGVLTGEEELQRRWGVESLRKHLHERAEALLDRAERGEGPPVISSATGDAVPDFIRVYRNKPVPSVGVSIDLSGVRYEVTVADEQAKLNLNTLLENHGVGRVRDAVNRLAVSAGGGRRRGSAVRIRELNRRDSAAKSSEGMALLSGYGQVFDSASPSGLLGDKSAAGLASHVTLWGDGRVSLRRCSAEVIRTVCEQTIGKDAATAIITARDYSPYARLKDVLAAAEGLDKDQANEAMRLFTDQSLCHSVWITVRGAQREWRYHSVGISGGVGEMKDDELAVGFVSRRYEAAW